MKAQRNCDGSGADIVVCGITFDRCPVAWLRDYGGEGSIMLDLLVDCCGGVLLDEQMNYAISDTGAYPVPIAKPRPILHLPFPGGLNDQPAVIMAAFRVMQSKAVEMATEARNG